MTSAVCLGLLLAAFLSHSDGDSPVMTKRKRRKLMRQRLQFNPRLLKR